MIDMIGKKFGKLYVIRFAGKKGKKPLWNARCECGSEKVYVGEHLRSGNTKSCGCFRESIVGKNRRMYQIYRGMKQRCYDKNHQSYYLYGGKGIIIEWDSFNMFHSDMLEEYINHCNLHGEKNTTIDRIDFNKNYSKSNCRWATYKDQGSNTSKKRFIEFKGNTYRISELAKILLVRTSQLHYRISIGTDLSTFYSQSNDSK